MYFPRTFGRNYLTRLNENCKERLASEGPATRLLGFVETEKAEWIGEYIASKMPTRTGPYRRIANLLYFTEQGMRGDRPRDSTPMRPR